MIFENVLPRYSIRVNTIFHTQKAAVIQLSGLLPPIKSETDGRRTAVIITLRQVPTRIYHYQY